MAECGYNMERAAHNPQNVYCLSFLRKSLSDADFEYCRRVKGHGPKDVAPCLGQAQLQQWDFCHLSLVDRRSL